jgi:hypothetical protein
MEKNLPEEVLLTKDATAAVFETFQLETLSKEWLA